MFLCCHNRKPPCSLRLRLERDPSTPSKGLATRIVLKCLSPRWNIGYEHPVDIAYWVLRHFLLICIILKEACAVALFSVLGPLPETCEIEVWEFLLFQGLCSYGPLILSMEHARAILSVWASQPRLLQLALVPLLPSLSNGPFPLVPTWRGTARLNSVSVVFHYSSVPPRHGKAARNAVTCFICGNSDHGVDLPAILRLVKEIR